MVCINLDILDIKEYIASGILEGYAMGILSEQETREVECMSKIYPEIKEELLLAQSQMEAVSETWKKPVPSDLKAKVMQAIANEPLESTIKSEAKVISINKGSQLSTWRAIAAVTTILLAVMGGFYLSSRSEMKQQEFALAEAKVKTNELLNQVNQMEISLAQYNAEEAFFVHDKTQRIALTGTALSPDSKMRVFWNDQMKRMVMTGTDLPQTAQEMQYQLWAIVDGKPVDLGVFDLLAGDEIQGKNLDVDNVQAFAVTLEKRGGSPTPTLDQMYVYGGV